jgi:hypothetical protein
MEKVIGLAAGIGGMIFVYWIVEGFITTSRALAG